MNTIKNINFDEMAIFLLGEEESNKIKEVAAKKTDKAMSEWAEEIAQIMCEIEENNDIIENIGGEPMKHKILLDTVGYSEKPAGKEAGAIQKRLPNCATEVSVSELALAVISGKTFKTNYMTGRSQDTFVSSSLIAVDIDNKGEELGLHGYKSIESFIEDTKKSNFKPALVYTTFSHTEEVHKYRAVFQLDRVVTNLNELKAIGQAIKTEYPYSDAKVSVVHPIFGGKDLILLDPAAIISPEVKFEDATSSVKGKSVEITKVIGSKKELTKELLISNLSAIKDQFKGKRIDIVNSFDWINENIPMTAALGYDLNTRFRCVFPDHRDEKPSARISETVDGRQNYICSCQNTYTSLIDVVAKALNMNKVLVQYLITDALGIIIGSEYQRNMRLLIADIMANTDYLIKDGSILDKFMTRSRLHGVYNLIQQFASAHITVSPIGANDKITFFMSQSQLRKKMEKLHMKGTTLIGYKLNTLKELGLIRALKDEEINPAVLKKAKEVQLKMSANLDSKYMRRVEFYELTILTPEDIEEAERIITVMKEAGVKRKRTNVVRRAAALGEEFVSDINVQVNVSEKVNDPKKQKKMDKMLKCSKKLIESQGYFTEDQLRKAYDPKRKIKKDVVQKMMNDFIPYIIKSLSLKKDRVKKSTRNQYSIDKKVKSNTVIYCI